MQRRLHGGAVYDAGARDIDQHRAAVETRQLGCRDQMLRVCGARCRQYHHIAVGQRLIEVVGADHGIHVRGTLAVGMATHARDVHAEGLRPLGDLEPDRAQPHNGHALAVQHPRPVH